MTERDELKEARGRNRELEAALADAHFKVRRRVRRRKPVDEGLVKSLVQATGPNQIWGSDITYMRTREDFAYLSPITDQYSKKVVGYHVGTGLSAGETLQALTMALDDLPAEEEKANHPSNAGQSDNFKSGLVRAYGSQPEVPPTG